MNYKVYQDGTYSYIVKTDEDKVDNVNVFDTLKKAKKSILEELRDSKKGFQIAINRINSLNDSDIEIE